jgi:F-type H+-transporting ATPase subunit delta
MRDRRVAMRYASALLAVLTDPEQAAAADEFLQAVSRAIDESTEFKALLLNPAMLRADRLKVLQAVAREKGMPETVMRFLAQIVDHNRTAALQSIAELFHIERERKIGIVPVEMTTASPLSDDLFERSQKALEHLTGRKVRLTCQVDPAILGGALTVVGSTIYDGSIRTQLNQLRRRMAQE